MNDFQLVVNHHITPEEAIKAANQIEKEVGEITNGLRKASKISIREIAVLVTYVRQSEF